MHTHKGLAPIPLNKGGASVFGGRGCISPNKGSTSTVCRGRGVTSSQKGVGVVLWVIIAAVVLGGGLFAVLLPRILHPVDDDRGQFEFIVAEEIKDWNTYRNEKYGFEFRYPNDWTVREIVPAPDMLEPWKNYAFYASYTRPNGQDHSGFVAVSKKSIDELTKDEPYIFSKLTYETERFAGTKATKVVSRFTNPDTDYSSSSFDYFIVKDGYTYIITGTATTNKEEPVEAQTREIQHSVLSTFRFTK